MPFLFVTHLWDVLPMCTSVLTRWAATNVGNILFSDPSEG